MLAGQSWRGETSPGRDPAFPTMETPETPTTGSALTTPGYPDLNLDILTMPTLVSGRRGPGCYGCV